MVYDIDIMICDFDYYIGFVDCRIWLLILDRVDGKEWKEGWELLESDGRRWEEVEDFGKKGFGVLGWSVVIATNVLRLMRAHIAIFLTM